MDPRIEAVAQLKEQGLEIGFLCAVFGTYGQEGTTISWSSIEGLSSLKADLSLTVYSEHDVKAL